MKLIDADSVKDFFFLETSGTEETIRDLAEKHKLTYLNNVNEDEVESFAKDLLKVVQNVIDTEPIAYDVDKVVEQLKQNTHDMEICEEQFDMNRPYFKDVPYKMIKLEDAIKIVKAGGKDGN